jgi:hypothetical protein
VILCYERGSHWHVLKPGWNTEGFLRKCCGEQEEWTWPPPAGEHSPEVSEANVSQGRAADRFRTLQRTRPSRTQGKKARLVDMKFLESAAWERWSTGPPDVEEAIWGTTHRMVPTAYCESAKGVRRTLNMKKTDRQTGLSGVNSQHQAGGKHQAGLVSTGNWWLPGVVTPANNWQGYRVQSITTDLGETESRRIANLTKEKEQIKEWQEMMQWKTGGKICERDQENAKMPTGIPIWECVNKWKQQSMCLLLQFLRLIFKTIRTGERLSC